MIELGGDCLPAGTGVPVRSTGLRSRQALFANYVTGSHTVEPRPSMNELKILGIPGHERSSAGIRHWGYLSFCWHWGASQVNGVKVPASLLANYVTGSRTVNPRPSMNELQILGI